AVALRAVLVGPFARLQLALEIYLGTLLQVLLGNTAQALIEDHDSVPLGLLPPLAGRLVAPAFRGRHPQIRNRPAILGAPNLRIRTQIANQDHFVDATGHDRSPS